MTCLKIDFCDNHYEMAKNNLDQIEDSDKSSKKALRSLQVGKRFCLTIHGQHKNDLRQLKKFFKGQLIWTSTDEPQVKYVAFQDQIVCAIIAKEFGENKIHPHWQCYFELVEKVRIKSHIAKVLGHENFHIERANGTKEHNVRYCYGVDKPYEIGWIVYKKNVTPPRDYNPQAYKFWKNFKLRDWQKELVPLLIKKEVDRREIIYIFDQRGGTGKTLISEYLHIYHGAIITGGKSADMKHAIARWQQVVSRCPTIIVVDICRSEAEGDFAGIESIKNGLFFSGKYESAMCHSVRKANLVIFSNLPPQLDRLSADRWKVGEIIDSKIVWK